MNKLEAALELARMGFRVFPLEVDSKLPHITGYPKRATTDEKQLKEWWTDPVMDIVQNYNIGISTNDLLVVDVDIKGDKNGNDSILLLEMEGKTLPETLTASTPTGGRHLYFSPKSVCRQGVDVLGSGLDIRAAGGFTVAPGSTIGTGFYKWIRRERVVEKAPDWLENACKKVVAKTLENTNVVETESAVSRAQTYCKTAEPAIEGCGGDARTFEIAAKLKDFGINENTAYDLLASHWNDRCSPPWSPVDLMTKVHNAYRYGANDPGVDSPAADFAKVSEKKPITSDKTVQRTVEGTTDKYKEAIKHPFDRLNAEYAFVIAGGGHHILWETIDSIGNFKLEHLSVPTFHQKFASKSMQIGNKFKPLTEMWMESERRRSYDGICFMPEKTAPERFYNLWSGFAVEPQAIGSQSAQNALNDLLSHIEHNICEGNERLFKWFIGYFAHMIQKPSEKPLVAIVLRGSKGTGKNAPIETIGHLLGPHFLLTSNKRFLTGHFNGHLENCLMFTLDEAFWSGDKQAEGALKDMVTGTSHLIELKGKEPYTVANLLRIVIIGNENWLVPTSYDERRFAIFDVGEGRKQDIKFFAAMRRGMEDGGYALLLHYLMNYDISGINVNVAPKTSALLDQKIASLEPFFQWWFDCLVEEKIVSSDFGNTWPDGTIETTRYRNAFQRYMREHNIRSRMPSASLLGRMIKECTPIEKVRERGTEGLVYIYKIPTLEECRECWEAYMEQSVNW